MSDIKINTDIDATVDRWFADGDEGDWVGIFENHDMTDPNLGARYGLVYGADQWDKAEVGRTTGPDTELGLGWRYVLVEKCKTADQAKEAMA